MNIDNFGHITDTQLEILQAMDIDGAEVHETGDGYHLTGDIDVDARDLTALIDAGLLEPATFALTEAYFVLADEGE